MPAVSASTGYILNTRYDMRYAIRCTLSAIRDKCIILHHKRQFLKHFGVLMTNKEPFCASLRLTRTVFTRLMKKGNNHSSLILNHLYGLHSFAFSLTSYGISSTKEYVRKNKLFMQNKANFRKVKFNVTKVLTKDYDQMDTWSIGTKQSQTNPNKAKLKKAKMNVTSAITKAYENNTPIRAPKKQSQIPKRQKPMQPLLLQRIMKNTAFSASEKTNPNKANQTQCLSAISVADQRQKNAALRLYAVGYIRKK